MKESVINLWLWQGNHGLDNFIKEKVKLLEISEWKKHLERGRKEKDIFFRVHPSSPIPFEERMSFKRLNYYPLKSNYRFELKLHEHKEKKILKMIDTKGNERKFLRWGEFRFRIKGKEYVLQAYKDNSEENRLFIPFRDVTSGVETYGAGRYLDLEPERHLTNKGKWILDFNQAYNPWCAYSEAYACPLIPQENCLDVAIRAGEKKYLHEKNRRDEYV